MRSLGDPARGDICATVPHGVGHDSGNLGGKTPGEDELIDTNYESYEKVPNHERQCKQPIHRSIPFCETRHKTAT